MRWVCTTVVAAIIAATPGARAGNAPGHPVTDLTGQLLVATDDLRDPRFFHTVIYLLRHDGSGAMGLVVNRAVGEVSLADLLDRFGLHREGASGGVRVHYGGPVEPAAVFVLHSTDYVGATSQIIKDGVAVTSHPDILRAMAGGQGPQHSLFVLGYAGWAPSQLEGEIARGDWVSVAADGALLFSDDGEGTWERAMARRRIEL
jgi:putative transcriptional regulator